MSDPDAFSPPGPGLAAAPGGGSGPDWDARYLKAEGGLFGETAEQAFFVRVDETTTTQDDRDNGRVNIVVGIAPVKPAEFVVFRIGQAPTSVILEESA